ncbi:LacI family DNA-binding transcriptional regulator [Streptomyces hainanensis]|uniref:LacI family transcriptional regulator n=1 Tax=Streptomyces hainanensis TaxID=402648 RepID=A0A4V2Y2U0_9ACTN|nr:LacI family DNA-binding transcriptional regulator [Streptomyces hainanensis]TDC73855.1 LacI family transcriptional regulator [Streptomyces hainanensis]
MTTGSRRPATMADVARMAGVSVPTVSRVLSGAARVSPLKRERVEEAVRALSFRPSAAARALVSRRPKALAVVAGDTSKYGYAETIRGIEAAARAAGHTVMISVVEGPEAADADRALRLVLTQAIAGVLVLKFDPPGVAALRRMPPDVPVVALSGAREPGVPQAVLDEAGAAEELTRHLLALGHPTVHHVPVPPSRREDGRTTGWRRALRAAGARVPALEAATWSPHVARETGRRLAGDASVSAVFCGNDEVAMGVIRGLADEGVRTPEDVSVAGFDDHPLAELWTPAITTVRQDFFGLGERGFALLTGVVDGTSRRRFSSERPEVVIRASTAPPATR